MTREEAIRLLLVEKSTIIEVDGNKGAEKMIQAYDMAIEALTNVQNMHKGEWRTGKPKKQGEYTVTVKSMRGGMVELLYYGKPIMPNYKVKGMCWYRSDDEWGDVVYDDADILAWQPLPTPYKGE